MKNFFRDGDFLSTMNSRGHFFSKWANSGGHFLRVNSHGQFLVVITNGLSANAGGAGVKPLLGSANTVQCQGSLF